MASSIGDPVAIVTGAARGIGAAVALRLATNGLRVVLADIDLEGARATAERIAATGGSARGVRVDLGDPASVDNLVSDVLGIEGRIDVLVNNAALFDSGTLWDVDVERWDRVQAVNLRGPFLLSRAAARHMRERGSGRIVNVSSLAGQQGGVFGGLPYSVSKAGVQLLTKVMAQDLGPSGVTVNAVAPAVIDGPVMASVDAAAKAEVAGRVPVRRLGLPEDVAAAVSYLTSDDAAFVTGATIDVNGGLHMR